MTITKTIEIDCPPGNPRPTDLLPFVLEGTGLEVVEPSSSFFGNFTFQFEVESEEAWEKVTEVVAPKLKKLNADGVIRYASW